MGSVSLLSVRNSVEINTEIVKGQKIAKAIYGILNIPKKQSKKFNLTQVDFFLFVFWEN